MNSNKKWAKLYHINRIFLLADALQQAENVEMNVLGLHTDTETLAENLPNSTARNALPLGVLVFRRGLTLLVMFIILAAGIALSVIVKR